MADFVGEIAVAGENSDKRKPAWVFPAFGNQIAAAVESDERRC